jgi:hypothetical protein
MVVREAPVAVCVTLISAPGITAPLSSRTVPAISAVACPQTIVEKNNIDTSAKVIFFT